MFRKERSPLPWGLYGSLFPFLLYIRHHKESATWTATMVTRRPFQKEKSSPWLHWEGAIHGGPGSHMAGTSTGGSSEHKSGLRDIYPS
jgi:hypothetical protein